MATYANSPGNNPYSNIEKILKRMNNVSTTSPAMKQIQNYMNSTLQQQVSQYSYIQPRSQGKSFAQSLAADWQAYQLRQLQQQAQYQPNPPSQKPSTPMNNEPEFEVGDILKHEYSAAHWRVLRVNKTTYRMQSLDANNHNIIGTEDTWDFGDMGDRVTLIEKAESSTPKVIVDFDTVIIADEKRQQILEALEQINQSDLIFKVWGFGETMEKGKGVAMLFYGPPGTGKTLMAQAIANKLGYKLKVISTADVESSAPGEAERNIRKHFKEAKGGKTILLFDECDSLIYSRKYVGAIMSAQINELLSQIERFDGITLFTTNRLGTLDEAVNRRLALKLEFDMPSPSERVEIWKRMFPAQAPLSDDIDWLRLAGVELTGGYIKNCVLRAARAAATEKCDDSVKCITMEHLIAAVTAEATSMADFEAAQAEHASGYGHVTAGHVRSRGKVETSS